MANSDSIFGAKLLNRGLPYKMMQCIIAAGDAVEVFRGDFVTHQGTSLQSIEFGGTFPVVSQAAAADLILGFVIDVAFEKKYEEQVYRSTLTERVVTVCVDPTAEFEMQCSATLAVEDIGLNADITVGSGSAITGVSGMELDHSTVATTATLPLRLVDLMNRADNEIGLHAKVVCRMNDCHFRSTTGQ